MTMPEITKGAADDVALQQVHARADRHALPPFTSPGCETDDCPYPMIGTVTFGSDGSQHHVCAICAVDLIDWRASHLSPTFVPAGTWPTPEVMAAAVTTYHAAWIAHGRYDATETSAGYQVKCYCGGWNSLFHIGAQAARDEHLSHRWETARLRAAETMLKAV